MTGKQGVPENYQESITEGLYGQVSWHYPPSVINAYGTCKGLEMDFVTRVNSDCL